MTEDVKNGKNYVIFPEGTRSRNGNRILEFKAGTFKSAVNAGCPIIPVALIDSYKVFNSFNLGPVTTQVHYLKPILFDEYGSLKTHEIAELVQHRIQEKINSRSTCHTVDLSLTYLRNIPESPLKIPFNIGVKHTTFCFLFLSL